MNTMLIKRKNMPQEIVLGVKQILTERDLLAANDRGEFFVQKKVSEMVYDMALLITMKSPHMDLEEETLP